MIVEQRRDETFELECQSVGCSEAAHFFVDMPVRGRWLLCQKHREVACSHGGEQVGEMW